MHPISTNQLIQLLIHSDIECIAAQPSLLKKHAPSNQTPKVILLDVQSMSQYPESHFKCAIHITVPYVLLKRPSVDIPKILNMALQSSSTTHKGASITSQSIIKLIQQMSPKDYIIVYDNSTTKWTPCDQLPLQCLVSKLETMKDRRCHICWLQGGINTLHFSIRLQNMTSFAANFLEGSAMGWCSKCEALAMVREGSYLSRSSPQFSIDTCFSNPLGTSPGDLPNRAGGSNLLADSPSQFNTASTSQRTCPDLSECGKIGDGINKQAHQRLPSYLLSLINAKDRKHQEQILTEKWRILAEQHHSMDWTSFSAGTSQSSSVKISEENGNEINRLVEHDSALTKKRQNANDASFLSGKEAVHHRSISDPTGYAISAALESMDKNRYRDIWPYDKNRVRLRNVAIQDDYMNASHIRLESSSTVASSNSTLFDAATPSSNVPSCEVDMQTSTRSQQTAAGHPPYCEMVHDKRYEFISTQEPPSNCVADFWKMVMDENVSVIVMLSEPSSDPYFPTNILRPAGSNIDLSDEETSADHERTFECHDRLLSVKLRNEMTIKCNSIIRLFELCAWSKQCGDNSLAHSGANQRTIYHIYYRNWRDKQVPCDTAEFIEFVQFVRVLVNRLSAICMYPSPVLVHCSAGCGRTGVFITLYSLFANLFEKQTHQGSDSHDAPQHSTMSITDDQNDAILSTVRILRAQRMYMVQTYQQFIFCYEALLVMYAVTRSQWQDKENFCMQAMQMLGI